MSFATYGDWTDRIAKGELPNAKPPRPQGVERNIVVTLRDWMNEKQYLHDLISSDRRYPDGERVRSALRIARVQLRHDADPRSVKNMATTFKLPVRDPQMPLSLGPGHAAALEPLQPSPYWGTERIWDTRANNHNSMFDETGALWLAASVRAPDEPGVLQGGIGSSVGEGVPDGSRRAAPRDVRSEDEEVHASSTRATRTHHPQFGYDANDTLWTSGGGPVSAG